METKVPLVYENYYDIYHRKNNGIDIFFETDNYYCFVVFYTKYIESITQTYARFLLKKDLRTIVFIKEKNKIKLNDLGYNTTKKSKDIERYKGFFHLFNAYIEALNQRRSRTRYLVETKLEKKIISSKNYSQQLIYYILNNLRFNKQRNIGKTIAMGKLKVVNYMKINIAIKWVE
jgi:hypothetical protein